MCMDAVKSCETRLNDDPTQLYVANMHLMWSIFVDSEAVDALIKKKEIEPILIGRPLVRSNC